MSGPPWHPGNLGAIATTRADHVDEATQEGEREIRWCRGRWMSYARMNLDGRSSASKAWGVRQNRGSRVKSTRDDSKHRGFLLDRTPTVRKTGGQRDKDKITQQREQA